MIHPNKFVPFSYRDWEISDALNHLALFVDQSGDEDNIEALNHSINLGKELDQRLNNSILRVRLLYILANAFGNIRKAKSNNVIDTDFVWHEAEMEKEITYLRRAIYEEDFDKTEKILQVNIFTNLANLLDSIGRYIPSIGYWDEALKNSPNFGQAMGNKGYSLIINLRYQYEDKAKLVFLKEGIRLLKEALVKDNIKFIHPAGVTFFREQLERAKRYLPIECANCDIELNSFNLGESTKEIKYRTWCLKEKLFLNPLNELGIFNEAGYDSVFIPSLITPTAQHPSEIGLFNQIKQEYVSARFLLYDGLENRELHFSDRQVLLLNTLDYPVYGLSIEKVKLAFRSFYSIFDHIAYLMNIYFSLNIREGKVSFPKIWYQNGDKQKGIHKILKQSKNVPLRGLYWVSKDLFEDKEGFKDLINPDAREVHKIRRFLEHRYLKVITERIVMCNESDLFFDENAFYISEHDFHKKTLKLASLVRESIIYLALAINIEERNRKSEKKSRKQIQKSGFDFFPDKFKF